MNWLPSPLRSDLPMNHYRCETCGHIELVSMRWENPPQRIDYMCDRCMTRGMSDIDYEIWCMMACIVGNMQKINIDINGKI